MAKKKPKKEKIIFRRVVSSGEHGRHKANLVKKSPLHYALVIFALEQSTKEVEETEIETYTEKESKIRPLNPENEKAGKAMQKKIDDYLKDSTIEEALEIVEGEDKEEQYLIESELDFKVERYLVQTKQRREVPVIKEVEVVKEKKIDTLDFYFRPSSSIIQQSVKNYLKSK